jgi:prephenate dehydratase
MKVGYLGPNASFTHLAVKRAFTNVQLNPYMTIPECIEAASAKEVDIAVVPLENALEGSVNLTIDYLVQETDLKIIAELILPIRQHLMMHAQYAVEEEIRPEKVLSHSHAIAQCHKFLHQQLKGVPVEYTSSTSAAAKWISEHPEKKYAAIGNELAAKEYNLTILKKDIHDYEHNHTRFIVVSRENFRCISQSTKQVKTTVMVMLPSDYAGALHQVLSAFSWRKLNLTKIESRPMKTGLGNYYFIIDIEKEWDDVLLPGAVAEMEALGCQVKVLGSYPSYSFT